MKEIQDVYNPNMNFENDPVNKPAHYANRKYEVIDVIADNLTPEMYEGYCAGNVQKYLSRYPHKNGSQDLKKARVYLDWLIKVVEERER